MGEARFTEQETGIAQPALMDLMNQSLTMLYERSTMRPLDRHWSRGLYLGNYRVRLKTVIDDVSRCPLNFLSLTVFNGIVKYAEHIIDSQSGDLKSDTIKCLLNCFLEVSFELLDPRLEDYLNLIFGLLQRGADPNFNGPGGTIWHALLDELWRLENRFNKCVIPRSRLWTDIILICLRNGAKINKWIFCDLETPTIGVTHLASSRPIKMTHYAIMLHLSPRSVLHECFAKRPEYSEIEDILEASGASLCSRCIGVWCVIKDGDDHKGVSYTFAEPEEQLQKLQKTFEDHLETSEQNYEKRRQIFDRQVDELFQGLDPEQYFNYQRQTAALPEPPA